VTEFLLCKALIRAGGNVPSSIVAELDTFTNSDFS